jgi:rSAM/selenodomain-associated transferase 2
MSTEARHRISIVVPTLDEELRIGATLAPLQQARRNGVEVLVADGGSLDTTVAIATGLADKVVQAPRGRALQLNAGAAGASGSLFVFLHADSMLPPDFERTLQAAVGAREQAWGRFDVRITGDHRLLRLIGIFMNARSRLTGIATGDQGIFVTRALFERTGGFPSQPLMEDIAFCKSAKRLQRPQCLHAQVSTSGRRWLRQGIWRTVLLMWRLRLAYFFGADPVQLATRYRDVR